MGASRKDIVFNKFKDSVNESDLKTIITYLSSNDPSGTDKYLLWMADQYYGGPGKWKPNGTIESVSLFHKHQSKITTKVMDQFLTANPYVLLPGSDLDKTLIKVKNNPKDINSYGDGSVLIDFMNYVEGLVVKEKKQTIKESQFRLIHEDNDYRIVVPCNYETSVKLGYGTKWCVASKETSNHFKSYTKTGILYYIFDKVRNSPDNPLSKIACYVDINSLDNLGTFNAPDRSMGHIEHILPPKIVEVIKSDLKSLIGVDQLLPHIIESFNNKEHQILLKNPPREDCPKLPTLNLIPAKTNKTKNQIFFNISGFKDYQVSLDVVPVNNQINIHFGLVQRGSNQKEIPNNSYRILLGQLIETFNLKSNIIDNPKNQKKIIVNFKQQVQEWARYNIPNSHHAFVEYAQFLILYKTIINCYKEYNQTGCELSMQDSPSFESFLREPTLKFSLTKKKQVFRFEYDFNEQYLTFDGHTHTEKQIRWESKTTFIKKSPTTLANIKSIFNSIMSLVNDYIDHGSVKIPKPKLPTKKEMELRKREILMYARSKSGYDYGDWGQFCESDDCGEVIIKYAADWIIKKHYER